MRQILAVLFSVYYIYAVIDDVRKKQSGLNSALPDQLIEYQSEFALLTFINQASGFSTSQRLPKLNIGSVAVLRHL